MQKVMILDDDQTMQELLKTLLEIEGFQVIQINEAKQEILFKTITYEKPQFLVMDVNLRQTNGLDIVRFLRANKLFRNLRIIMISGMDIQDSCLESGADTFLMKPFMPEELIGSLK